MPTKHYKFKRISLIHISMANNGIFYQRFAEPCNFVLLVLTTSIISPIFIFWVLFVHLIETYYAGLSSLLLIKRSSFVMIHLLIEQLFSALWICYSCSNKWAYTNLARFVMYGSCINWSCNVYSFLFVKLYIRIYTQQKFSYY